jgi:hypothetical protein
MTTLLESMGKPNKRFIRGLEVKHRGVEMHYKDSPYDDDRAPSQLNCWLIHQPCWHGGSSLLCSETMIPWFMEGFHDAIFRRLESFYLDNLKKEED